MSKLKFMIEMDDLSKKTENTDRVKMDILNLILRINIKIFFLVNGRRNTGDSLKGIRKIGR